MEIFKFQQSDHRCLQLLGQVQPQATKLSIQAAKQAPCLGGESQGWFQGSLLLSYLFPPPEAAFQPQLYQAGADLSPLCHFRNEQTCISYLKNRRPQNSLLGIITKKGLQWLGRDDKGQEMPTLNRWRKVQCPRCCFHAYKRSAWLHYSLQALPSALWPFLLRRMQETREVQSEFATNFCWLYLYRKEGFRILCGISFLLHRSVGRQWCNTQLLPCFFLSPK